MSSSRGSTHATGSARSLGDRTTFIGCMARGTSAARAPGCIATQRLGEQVGELGHIDYIEPDSEVNRQCLFGWLSQPIYRWIDVNGY